MISVYLKKSYLLIKISSEIAQKFEYYGGKGYRRQRWSADSFGVVCEGFFENLSQGGWQC
jgi:hypothetical protein